MDTNILLIKNMVCQRCVKAVEDVLQQLSVPATQVFIGEAHLKTAPDEIQIKQVAEALAAIGLELIDNRTGALVEKIKQLTLAKARNEIALKDKINLSDYLAAQLHHEYTYLSSLFSDIEGRTIENFFIEQRIEKAKELLVYGQMNLSEIALALDYSSVAHLSAQFKKVTGLTPTHFKSVGAVRRKPLDSI